MFRVIETFSGIGSQVKALSNLNKEFEIVHTVEWDIHAIIAYYLIHGDVSTFDKYSNLSEKIVDRYLTSLNLSYDGKKTITKQSYNRLSLNIKRVLYAAITECNDLVNVTDLKSDDIDNDIDLLTYSFPCQDLSIAGYLHGNSSGISKKVKNRSGMLWEIERVLLEMDHCGKRLPKFLLMENVVNILSNVHKKDFSLWKSTLNSLGYVNKVYRLKASDFGIPQKRERAYMISVQCNNDKKLIDRVNNYFLSHDLEAVAESQKVRSRVLTLEDILRLDYSNPIYKLEADLSKPNDTPSRRRIFMENDLLFDGKKVQNINVSTVTTKQDRNPNSGLVIYKNNVPNKPNWRYLTPRECFMLMGFTEEDYNCLAYSKLLNIDDYKRYFSYEKMIKLAGNSIVVDVLEAIFKQIYDLNEAIY